MFDHRLDVIEIFELCLAAQARTVRGPLGCGTENACAHVAILGIGEDEVRALVFAGPDPRQFLVQLRRHANLLGA